MLLFLPFASTSPAFAAAQLTADTFLIEGKTPPDRQPDGNTVVLIAPKGLIVFDTGRHEEHTRQIMDFARARNRGVAAIVNSHWHLDHVGGNPRLRAAFPELHVYAGDAIDEARTGFLARYRGQLVEQMAKGPADSPVHKDLEAEIALIDQGAALGPTDIVRDSGARDIAGRSLELHLETRAVTAGDVWVYDKATRVLLAGDLVTLPAPFLDTACPARWLNALERLEQTPFTRLVPGHGRPLQRAELEAYRQAFAGFLRCAAGTEAPQVCVEDWTRDAATLIKPGDLGYARALAGYYVENTLRGPPERLRALCAGSV